MDCELIKYLVLYVYKTETTRYEGTHKMMLHPHIILSLSYSVPIHD